VVRQKLHFLEPGTQFSLVDAGGRPLAYQEVGRRPMKVEWDPQREHFYCEGRACPAVVVSPREMWDTGGRWRRWFGEEVEVLFTAGLPAGGYTTVLVGPKQDAPAEVDTTLSAGENWLENDLVRVEVAGDGSFEVLDKSTGRRYGPLNVVRSEADRGDEYSFCPAEGDRPVSSRGGRAAVTLVERGPWRATLEISLGMQVPAALTEDRTRRIDETVVLPIRTRVSLDHGSRRVEVHTELGNMARDHRLRALFATGVRTDVADAQGQFQVMRRAVELPAEERDRVPEFDEEQEVSYHPQRAFVDVSADGVGFAVLNRGLPEYEAEPSDDRVVLGVTLLRCVGWLSRDDLSTRYKHAGPALETPEAQCLGRHTFEYAVVPHEGDWLAGGVALEAEAYVTPVYSAPLSGDAEQDEVSFYSISPDELLFSACKRSEDGRSLILRVYNTAPHPVDGTLRLGFPAAVSMANLAERELSDPLALDADGRTYRFQARPHEIVTFSIRPQ
jgi:alpha-mannosidase